MRAVPVQRLVAVPANRHPPRKTRAALVRRLAHPAVLHLSATHVRERAQSRVANHGSGGVEDERVVAVEAAADARDTDGGVGVGIAAARQAFEPWLVVRSAAEAETRARGLHLCRAIQRQ